MVISIALFRLMCLSVATDWIQFFLCAIRDFIGYFSFNFYEWAPCLRWDLSSPPLTPAERASPALFCRMTLKSPAGRSCPSVSSDRTGLFCVPVIPVLPSPIPMPVEPPDLNQPNLLKVGDAEPPAPGRSDSWMSPQRLPELKFLFGPPACIPLEWVWTPAAAVRGCDRELG